MDMSVERKLQKELEDKEKQNQKLRQDKLDKERAALLLMAMRAELASKFSASR